MPLWSVIAKPPLVQRIIESFPRRNVRSPSPSKPQAKQPGRRKDATRIRAARTRMPSDIARAGPPKPMRCRGFARRQLAVRPEGLTSMSCRLRDELLEAPGLEVQLPLRVVFHLRARQREPERARD